MEQQFSKLDETTLQVVKPVEVREETKTFDLDFLKQQEINILKQKNDFIEARDLELEEVRELIAQCEILKVRSKTEVALEAETAREATLEPIIK